VKGCGVFVLSLSKDCSWFDKPVLSLPKGLTTNGMWLVELVLAKSLRMWDDNQLGVNWKDEAR